MTMSNAPTITAPAAARDALRLYEEEVRALPTSERLRLATLILNDIAPPPSSVVDERDDWSEEDLREWSLASRKRMSEMFDDDEDISDA